MSKPDLKYVVVSGNSGTGKSTLLKAIVEELESRDLSVQGCDEKTFHHPHLQQMFDHPDKWALPIQLNFVTQRACYLLEAAAETEAHALVMERCLVEDGLFFRYYVERGDIAPDLITGYEQLVAQLVSSTPTPDIMVHLRGTGENLFARLERAYAMGYRKVELTGPPLLAYLNGMNRIYDAWAEEIPRFARHYLEFDFADLEVNMDEIVDRIASLVTGSTEPRMERYHA